MKQVGEIVKVVQRQNSLQTLSPQQRESTNEISIYTGGLSTQCLIQCIATIKKAFPALPIDFYEVFRERIRFNGFSDQRLRDAVSNVIDTCPYPTPTIANFISFDRKYKIFTYEDMIHKGEEFGKEIWDSYKKIRILDSDKPVWVHINDVNKYDLKTEE